MTLFHSFYFLILDLFNWIGLDGILLPFFLKCFLHCWTYKNMCIWCITAYRARVRGFARPKWLQISHLCGREKRNLFEKQSLTVSIKENVTDAIVTWFPGYLLSRYRMLPATFVAISRDWRNSSTYQLWLRLIMRIKNAAARAINQPDVGYYFARYRTTVNLQSNFFNWCNYQK